MKVARTVLNGESGSNAADLHNGIPVTITDMLIEIIEIIKDIIPI